MTTYEGKRIILFSAGGHRGSIVPPSNTPAAPKKRRATKMHLRKPVDNRCVVTLGFGAYPPDLQAMKPTADHEGVDFAPPHTIEQASFPIMAAADGNVLYTGFNNRGGYFVILSHITPQNLILTYYMHIEQTTAFRGRNVLAGETIATMGNTGITTGKHLHFGIAIVSLTSLKFIDPAPHFI